MAINILRGRTGRPKRTSKTRDDGPPGAIGEPDAHVFNCPKCSRPLNDGTPRCPTCGQRLILGVMLRRASILTGFGFIIGVFAGGVLTSGFIGSLLASAGNMVTSVPAAAAAQPTAAPTASPTPSPLVTPAPTAVPSVIPPAAISALSQLALLDTRIAADGSAARAYSSMDGGDIARTLRSLASDAANGTDQISRLASWSDAATLSVARATFYRRITDLAHDTLRSSVNDTKAYRAAAATLVTILADLKTLGADSSTLAATIGATLPAVDLGPFAAK
jgi:hypothetical protein